MHKHHIIPKHAGGTDDPSNLVTLTVEEHAQAHLELYEKYGRWQDRVAHQTLSGQISKYEASQEVRRLSNMGNDHFLGKNHTNETKQKISEKQKVNMIGKVNALGHKKTNECKKLLSEKAARYRWITNGIDTKQWLKSVDIPEGYRAGRK